MNGDPRKWWTQATTDLARQLCTESQTAAEAAEKLSARLGRVVSKKSLLRKLQDSPGPVASDLLGSGSKPLQSSATVEASDHLDVVRAVQSGARTLEQLCDRLRCPPSVARQRVQAAREEGYDLSVDDATIRFEAIASDPVIAPAGASPTDRDPVVFAAIADTHFGSAECAADELREFVEYAYEQGARHVLHAGDIFEGCYHRGHHHELREVSYERQCDAALRVLPELDGLRYYTITGNHDYNSYHRTIGMDPGRGLVARASLRGRHDITHLGHTQGRLLFGEGEHALRVELVHPQKGGTAYAKSYPVQKWIETYEGGDKPHIAILGHLHSYSVIEVRNVVAIQPGCFQWQTAYEQSKGLQPAVGGALVWAYRDDTGFRFRHEWRRWWPRGATWEVAQ
jgi:predicted phosphodiesterase